MTPINNSDTAWLVVSDYNQENNLPFEELREDILSPDINQWHYEYHNKVVGARCRSGLVGDIGGNTATTDTSRVGREGFVCSVGSHLGKNVGGIADGVCGGYSYPFKWGCIGGNGPYDSN